MSFCLNVPLSAHRNCKYVMRDSTVCGAAFVAMSAQQEVCAIHSDAQRMKTTKENRKKMKNQMPGKPEAPDSANALTNKILIEVPRHFTCRLWRRNVGAGYPSSVVAIAKAMLQRNSPAEALRHLQNSRPVTFGMPGEADIDGIICIDGWGVRLMLEVKVGRDKQNEAQFACERVMTNLGGIYLVVSSVDGAIASVRREVEKRSTPVK